MIRTQLYLDPDLHRRLRDLADKQGRTGAVAGVLYDSDVIIEILRGRAVARCGVG